MKPGDAEPKKSVVLQMKSIDGDCTKTNIAVNNALNHRPESPDTTTSTSSTSSHDNSHVSISRSTEPIVFIPKKSVSFKEQNDILLIPTRHEVNYMIESLHLRRVHFNKVVNVLPVPSRQSLQCVAHELWYNENQIAKFENQVFNHSV